MRVPTKKKNRIVQIDVTSLCDKACSNCTRALAQLRKPDMSPEQFEQAVEASHEWIKRENGTLAIFGGNPCVSKNFETYCEILSKYLPPKNRGLWTNNLVGKGNIARKFFDRSSTFNFNVHEDKQAAKEISQTFPWAKIHGVNKASEHATLFAASSEFVDDDQLWQLVQQCSYDIHWSAIIVQEAPDWSTIGGYSCEIASTHARVNGVAHGVPVVPGWLDCELSEVEHQYRFACPKCSGCLNLKGIPDSAKIDQFSVSNADLVQLNWAKTRQHQIVTDIERSDHLPVSYLR